MKYINMDSNKQFLIKSGFLGSFIGIATGVAVLFGIGGKFLESILFYATYPFIVAGCYALQGKMCVHDEGVVIIVMVPISIILSGFLIGILIGYLIKKIKMSKS
jgi:hypothetical protein